VDEEATEATELCGHLALTEEQWARVLEAPAFQMATCLTDSSGVATSAHAMGHIRCYSATQVSRTASARAQDTQFSPVSEHLRSEVRGVLNSNHLSHRAGCFRSKI
jgi:hypothetical protein